MKYRNQIKSVIIQNGVTTIGVNAFKNCIGLKEVTILASITEIGSGAFNNCSGLETITILGLGI